MARHLFWVGTPLTTQNGTIMTTSTTTLPGILFVWTNADPEHELDFNRWYDREHVEERVRIPCFVSGTRYQSVRGPRKYLGLYRTVSLAAFQTADYFKAFGQQTPWSVANLQRMVDPMRRVCAIEAETGMGTGAWPARLGGSEQIQRPLAPVPDRADRRASRRAAGALYPGGMDWPAWPCSR